MARKPRNAGFGNAVIVGGIAGDSDGADSADNSTASAVADGPIIIDPSAVTGDDGPAAVDSTEPARKRRGRKPGSVSSKKTSSLDINGVENILYSIHTMLAAMTSVPEWQLDKSEARMLAEASASVAAHYDVSASAKTIAWTNLIMVAGTVYGTRIIAIRARNKKDKPPRSPASVQELRPRQPIGNISGIGEIFQPDLSGNA